MIELPRAFIERMDGMLGDELPAFVDALLAPESALRVNTLRLTPGEFEAIAPFALERLAYPEGGYTIYGEARPGKHPYHAAGLYYMQDPGAMAVGALVGARPGERVLDLSAAPGGKATLLAAAMANTGVLVANDVSRPRALELLGNLERCGVRNAIVTAESAGRLASHFGGWFDRVLVDAPCSGESMFRKSEAARRDWTVDAVEGCARRQADVMRTAGDLVRPGGVLCYSTCTFSLEENERVVESFLRDRKDYELAAGLPSVPGAEPVDPRSEGASGGSSGPGASGAPIGSDGSSGAAAYRLWPHRMPGAGHFIAIMRRVDGDEGDPGDYRFSRVPPPALDQLRAFLGATWRGTPIPTDRVDVRGSALFLPPDGAPDLTGLRLIRAGLELGEAKSNRFEPAHAHALAVPPDLAESRVDLPVASPDVDRYLSGHPIVSDGQGGWWPVAVDGFALGWGKRVGATVKNHYPKGLRRPG